MKNMKNKNNMKYLKRRPVKLIVLAATLFTMATAHAQADTRIEAENYNDYFDSDIGNNGGAYRSDNVDIEASSDTGGGFNVGWIQTDEWLEYSVELIAGTYEISTRVASNIGGGNYTLLVDGNSVATDNVANTGGWQAWQTHSLGSISAQTGTHIVRVDVSGGNFNLNWINFEVVADVDSDSDSDNDGVADTSDACPNTPAGAMVDSNGCEIAIDSDSDGIMDVNDACPNTPFGVAVNSIGCAIPIATNLTVQAEDYSAFADTDAGNNGGAYRSDDVDIEATSDIDGGFNVGWIQSGEWLEYTTSLVAGDYDISTRVASNVGGGNYTVSIGGAEVGRDSVANTGGWQTWETHSLGAVTITGEGPHTLRVDISSGSFNLNWIQFNAVTIVDSDLDGVADGDDACPNTPLGNLVDSFGCTILMDTDSDGVADGDDACPNTAPDANVDLSGCEIIIPSNEYIQQLGNGDVLFNANITVEPQFSLIFIRINGIQSEPIPTNIDNGNGSYSIQYTHAASNVNDGDVIEVRFYYAPVSGGQDFIPGPTSTTWSEAFTYGDSGGPNDGDGDGVTDDLDYCPNTAAGVNVDANGCPIDEIVDTDGDGVIDANDNCPNTPTGTTVDANGCALGGGDNDGNDDGDNDGVLDINDACLNTPPGAEVDAVGCVVGGGTGDIVPLFSSATALGDTLITDRGDAIVTYFGDRARDRHAKEDQFQSYDHYLTHYWFHRTARFKFVDYVAKGGSTIDISFVTEFRLGPTSREFRAWYSGMGSVAQYYGNYGPMVAEQGPATYNKEMQLISNSGEQYLYTYTISEANPLNGDGVIGQKTGIPLAVGQFMEIEVSQFLDGILLAASGDSGRAAYYGTTFLYEVGKGGMVPWDTLGDFDDKASQRENSVKIPESAWLGGRTTLPYTHTDESDNHFMQMATNLAPEHAQPFVKGRRVLHTNMSSGVHDESADNGSFPELTNLAGNQFVNDSCTSCHDRNGRAAIANVGENLNKWVFKVASEDGSPDAFIGSALQPNGSHGEGRVQLGQWTDVGGGLRSPNYVFSGNRPARFSARLAPQLVGLGLLEAIGESTILQRVDANDSNSDGISGRAQISIDPTNGNTRLGRFGWKAATASVKHQIASALNTDMGVTTSLLPNPDCGSQQNNCGGGQPLADEHLEDITQYVSLLGIRPQRDISNADVISGQQIFNDIGCEDCHRATMTTSEFAPSAELRSQVIHPYTDMLLHDMGPGLADNLGEGVATGAEWRTTPLWSIGLSSCVTGGVTGVFQQQVCSPSESYLHDGRARTLEEAILWHGGEGQGSNDNFTNLSNTDKTSVIKFLESL